MTRSGIIPSVEHVDALLPQAQCTRCGFAACRPYAEAIAAGTTGINRCPPGGSPVIAALAALLGVPPTALDPDCGAERAPHVVLIVEDDCIGCAKCIEVCPTDAIVGARKWLHTVIADDCSGCDLCLPACPVDCILSVPAPGYPPTVLDGAAIARRARHFGGLYTARQSRRHREEQRSRAALASALADDPSAAGEVAP